MNVPDFWNPIRNWLHGETGNMRQGDKGVSDNYRQLQDARAAAYTFDWEKTDAAWYRQHLQLPQDLSGRRFELCFDAIAKIAEVWVNGQFIGKQIGMFREFKLDVTSALKPGDNLLAVKVTDNLETRVDKQDVQDIAVTVEVTSEMLNNLPHAIYTGERIAGIWPPVKLGVTRPVHVAEVFAKTRLDGTDVEVTISNAGSRDEQVNVLMDISPANGGESIHRSQPETLLVKAGERKTITLQTGLIQPELWSPAKPNLYDLNIILSQNHVVQDEHHTRIGFRTFEVRGNRLYLNGKPYWLRGGNHFPMAICPNDEALAKTFLQKAREGNMTITRTVCAPFNEMWLNQCDEIGMAVSYEGTWPWLMIRGDVPSAELLHIWRTEFDSLIKKYRNHPSVVMWTINNEMKFYIWDEGDLLERKWKVVSDQIKRVRELDPTRPIVPDSGYRRTEARRPSWADDGDIDDLHAYYGWYNPTFFHSADLSRHTTPGRPFISQEMVGGGYANNDSGHPTRAYLFLHNTPQALVGRYAYEDQNPDYFLNRSRFMYKELAEALRRENRDVSAGIIHFAAITWFKNVYDAKRIEPYPTYYDMKLAQQPVLISAELFGRHAYAGTTLSRRVCIINDHEEFMDLPATELIWQICAGDQVLSEGRQPVAPVPYYHNIWIDVNFQLPDTLPTPRTEALLKLTLS
ncbi:MAG: glycoside hydrolase family 2, partial [Kiritimatiellaceae bacterium]|nr:glycoside hydrolase family 2 [Kiritimatiellaceae bacterium]